MVFRNVSLLLCSVLLVSINLAFLPAYARSLPKRATVCNGESSLCDRSYGNVTFAGAHDSYAIGTSLAANQNVSIHDQLNAGIRMLQSQAHKSTNSTPTGVGIDLCHTSCSIFQGGAIEYWLGQIKNWTDANPTEVVTLLIVNSDGLAPSTFATAFNSTGLADKMYTPTSATVTKSSWPTLGTMVDSGKTIVGFLTTEANYTSVDYLLDEFSNIWENPYDQTTYPFNCSINRIGEGVTDSSSLMYISNQFLDSSSLGGLLVTPDTAALNTTNSISGTLSTSGTCASEHGTYPNFILTDFSTVPDYDLLKAVAEMNGVTYTATGPPSSTSSSSSSASSSSSGGATIRFPIWSSAALALFAIGSVALLL
ncbi:hypothetical protein CBS101457_002022 [Exobasidium rhododendri]|nr:hypothetical protein CBS101457_002022 [Exobasidium rhododendri]